MMPSDPTSAAPSSTTDNQPAALQLYLRDGLPDWDAISDDVCCSRCGYNLRTLTRPLCPECGLEFAWSDVLVRTFMETDFLIEHQWRRKPVRSMVATVFWSLFPRRFWRRISIHGRIHVGPLVVIWLLSAVLFICTIHATAVTGWLVADYLETGTAPWRTVPVQLRSVFIPSSPPSQLRRLGDACHDLVRLPQVAHDSYPCLPLYWLGIGPGAMLVLCALWQTMGAFRIRPEQMMRVLVYALPPSAIACGLVFTVWIVVGAVYCPESLTWAGLALRLVLKTLILTVVLSRWMRIGLRDYLNIPHALAVSLAAGLAGVLMALFVGSAFADSWFDLTVLMG